MKSIPFYKNRKDDMSCMLAVYRSALEFLTGQEYSWKQLEELAGYSPKKAAWTIKAWTELSQNGFDIEMFENFDYARYYKEGDSYLATFLKPHELEWQLHNTNLLEIKPLIPQFLRHINYHKKSPELADIDKMLKDGYLVTIQLNANILNQQPGYTAHMILVHDKKGDEYIAHDPGLTNAQANRPIPAALMWKAMGGQGNTTEVTGIRIKHGK